jgi:hypothetical protein
VKVGAFTASAAEATPPLITIAASASENRAPKPEGAITSSFQNDR